MGAYSPLPWAPKDIEAEVLKNVLQPTVDEMAKRGTPFIGLLYAGLAMTSKGIRVIEFNARFGDPETQVLLPRLKTPLAQLLFAAATKNLNSIGKLDWSQDCAVTVVLASENYPADPVVDLPITGITQSDQVKVFHAGTKTKDSVLHSAGGRVLTVTGIGKDLAAARNAAYEVISKISLAGAHYRSDIALKASQLGIS
jgi:phosphoribosylamine--glycine ligase